MAIPSAVNDGGERSGEDNEKFTQNGSNRNGKGVHDTALGDQTVLQHNNVPGKKHDNVVNYRSNGNEHSNILLPQSKYHHFFPSCFLQVPRFIQFSTGGLDI